MKIGLSTKLVGNSYLLNATSKSKLFDNSRRYQRVKTLDGGVAVENRGLFSADKIITVSVEFNECLIDDLSTFSDWIIVTVEGIYYCIAGRWAVTDVGIDITFEGIE